MSIFNAGDLTLGDVLVYDDDTIFLTATKSGASYILKSTDKGRTFSIVWTGTEAYSVASLFKTKAGSILVGCKLRRILRSTDKGVTWDIVQTGGTGAEYREFSQANRNPNSTTPYVYCAPYGAGGIGGEKSLMRSDDDGATWSIIYTITEDTDHIHGVFASHLMDGVVYLTTGDTYYRILKSTDSGTTFTIMASYVYGCDIRETGKYRFINSDIANSFSYLYRSSDDADWTRVNFGRPSGYTLWNTMHYDERGFLIYGDNGFGYLNQGGGGLWISEDEGDTWYEYLKGVDVGGIDVSDDGFIYVITRGGWTGARLLRVPLPQRNTMNPDQSYIRLFKSGYRTAGTYYSQEIRTYGLKTLYIEIERGGDVPNTLDAKLQFLMPTGEEHGLQWVDEGTAWTQMTADGAKQVKKLVDPPPIIRLACTVGGAGSVTFLSWFIGSG